MLTSGDRSANRETNFMVDISRNEIMLSNGENTIELSCCSTVFFFFLVFDGNSNESVYRVASSFGSVVHSFGLLLLLLPFCIVLYYMFV